MKKYLPALFLILVSFSASFSQNVFNPGDAIIRYNQSQPYGSPSRPDTNTLGLQKWVSTPTNGISTGSGTFDVTSYKAYFINLKGNKLVFRIKFPKTYIQGDGKKYPSLIFLHGAGEVACSSNNGIYNNEKQLQHGGKLFRDAADAGKFDGFLIYPQLLSRTSDCWDNWYTVNSNKYTAVISMIDSLAKYAQLDVDRVAVNGLSGGGFAAWRFAAIMPQRIAKIIPSAGAGSTTSRDVFVHIPIWFATGGKDVSPSPATAAYNLKRMKEIGADIRYTQYPDLGHNVWYSHWAEPDYFPYLNDTHKANPLVFFQRYQFCSGQDINVKIGITAGFYAYEWQKDGITIATRTNGVNTVVDPVSIISYTGNDITVKSFGTYSVRFKRSFAAAWSDWSPKPAVISAKPAVDAAPITVTGIRSKVLPAPDGSITVPLSLPAGFTNYSWTRDSDNAVVSTLQTYLAPVGTYKGKYNDQFGCPYNFSPGFTVIDANGSPKPAPATNLAATALSLTSTKLTWSQGTGETNFELYRGTSEGGPYTLINITNANVISYTDNGLDANATYYYAVRAVNASGAAANSNEASPDNGNTAPVIGTLTDMYVKTGGSAVKNFTITDNPGDVDSVSIALKPSFITLESLGGTDYRITANPTSNDIGWKEITVIAEDSKGKTSTKKFMILVADKDIKSVFVNLGSAGKSATAPWNNWLGTRAANSFIGNLKDETNTSTTIGISAVNAWSATTNLGHLTGNNSGVYPDSVLQSGIADNGAAKQINISGLDVSKLYNLVFVGSQNEGLAATASYASGNQVSVLDAKYNTNYTANLNSLAADQNGNIAVTITRTGASLFTYLNAIVIEEYDPAITLLNPSNLYAEPLDRNSVNITWSDKTNNESASEGYELERATNATFSQNQITILLPENTYSYLNTGLAANTRYYYRVRASNGTIKSEYSNTVSTITPGSIVYVNFNATVPNIPFPWNDLSAQPNVSLSKGALKNQSGSATTMSLKLIKFFNGEFTAGAVTGNNSGVVPDNCLKSAYWLDNSQLSEFQLSGLNTSKRYRIGFFGSSSAKGWFKGNYTATYSVKGRTVYLNSWENTSKVVYIGDLVPDAGGILLLDFSTVAAAGYGFNSGIIIEEYSDAQGAVVLNSVVDPSGMVVAASSNIQQYKISPNPFLNEINIDFYNQHLGDKVSAEVYDLTGRMVVIRNYNTLPAGYYKLKLTDIKSSGYSSLYLVALKVNGKIVQTTKMIRVPMK